MALLAVVTPCAAAPLPAPGARHHFDIPEGPAASVLEAFARQSGRQILFPYGTVANRRMGGVVGTLDDAKTLKRLSRAAGLAVVSVDGETIILEARAHGAPPPPSPLIRGRVERSLPARVSPPPPSRAAMDIVVTATKRTQSALGIPQTIDVLTGGDLMRLGVHTSSDLQDVLPALAVGTVEHGVTFAIRGITTTDITSKGDPGVAFNVDGIFIGRPIEQAIALFDVQRIEVLRGPQGTLYGKSSTGGAINVVTNAPVGRWEAYAQWETGNFGTQRIEEAVNVPVTDWLAVRAASDFNLHRGYLEPSGGGERKSSEDDRTGRLSARAIVSPAVTARATVTLGHVGGSGTGYAELGNFVNGTSSAAERRIYPNPYPARLDHHIVDVNGEVDADLGASRLTYVGAHQRFYGNELSAINNDPHDPDMGVTPVDPAVQIHGRFLTTITSDYHEARLASVAQGRWDYVVGGNFYHERIDENDHNFNSPTGNPNPADSTNASDIVGTTVHQSFGLFGQTTWHINEQIRLIGGLRFSHDDVRRHATTAFGLYGAAGEPCIGSADCIGGSGTGREGAAKLTYRAGLEFHATAADLFYASIATGYKSGGFNDSPTVSGQPTAYSPEQLTAYEAGYKREPVHGLTLQSSLFYYNYAKTQINGIVLLNGTGVLNTRIVPTVIYGWETTASWSILPRTVLALSVSVERSHYVRLEAGYLQNIDWSGLALDHVPPFVATTSLDRSWQLPGAWSLDLRLFSKISSHYFVSDFTSGLRFRQHGFTRSTATLTITAPGGRWYAQAFVQNIENRLQATSPPQNYDPAYPNAAYLNISDPRLYGLRIGVNFR